MEKHYNPQLILPSALIREASPLPASLASYALLFNYLVLTIYLRQSRDVILVQYFLQRTCLLHNSLALSCTTYPTYQSNSLIFAFVTIYTSSAELKRPILKHFIHIYFTSSQIVNNTHHTDIIK